MSVKKLKSQEQKKRPGETKQMEPKPQDTMEKYKAAGKLEGKVAIVTGGDSGIGRAVSIGFAKEGADIVIVYLNEDKDAQFTQSVIRKEGKEAYLIRGDLGDSAFAKKVISETLKVFSKIDIIVNNAAEQHPQENAENISDEQLERTFATNIFSQFYLVREALPHLKGGASIINTTSVTAYRGHETLLDYSTTKGAIVSFTRSLSQMLAKKKIRVNAVAPGPIWTPLIPSTFPKDHVAEFGQDTPLGRPGQPDEVAPAFIFLASQDASYITGQTIHVNGGEVING